MINEIPRAVKLGTVTGSCATCWEEQRGKLSLYNNDHLEDKVVSEPYIVTHKMDNDSNKYYYEQFSQSFQLKELLGEEMGHYLNHIPLRDIDYCIYCTRDRKFINDKQN